MLLQGDSQIVTTDAKVVPKPVIKSTQVKQTSMSVDIPNSEGATHYGVRITNTVTGVERLVSQLTVAREDGEEFQTVVINGLEPGRRYRVTPLAADHDFAAPAEAAPAAA